MTTITPPTGGELVRPPGSEVPEPWEPDEEAGRLYRFCWSPPIPAPGRFGDDGIRVVVTQYQDGSIATEGDDQPLVYLDAGEGLPLDDVRALAGALLDAAELAERWVRWSQGHTGIPDYGVVIVEAGPVEQIAIHCRPFEPDDPEYAGDRWVAIFYQGRLESSVVINGVQAAQLAGLLVGDRR